MNAFDYLQKNIEPIYSFYPGTTVQLISDKTQPPYRLSNGEPYFLGFINSQKGTYAILSDPRQDGAIERYVHDKKHNAFIGLPHNLHYRMHTLQIAIISNRIKDRVMLPMIENCEFAQTKTELVQLRIAVNMIMSLDIDYTDKFNWAEWIKELYWERKKVLHEWYLEYILPF